MQFGWIWSLPLALEKWEMEMELDEGVRFFSQYGCGPRTKGMFMESSNMHVHVEARSVGGREEL